MKLSSLPLKMSVSYRNRTYNRVLGGPRYIHLTKETNAVFSRLSHLFGYGCHIYESNHFRDEFPLYLILASSSIPVGIELRFTTSVFSLGLTMIKP